MQASGGGMIKNDSEKIKLPFRRMKGYVWALAGVWTIVTAVSLIWHSFHTKQETLEVAQTQARVAYEKDIIYRRWNAGHGGVYVPVIAITSYAMKGDEERFLAEGFDSYISKPIDIKEFLKIVNKLITTAQMNGVSCQI